MELPAAFVEYTQKLLGEEEFSQFLASLATDTPVSIRMNAAKKEGFPTSLWQEIPWCPGGYYLPQRPTFTFDPLFHAGCYYVQEASSMFLSQVVRTLVKKPVMALDLCAAPGGKSTLLLDTLPPDSFLVVNEVNPQRAQVLTENVIKWGDPYVMVTHSDSAVFSPLSHFFDFILADVPCSGEGMFRKDEVAIREWSLENVENCWKRQRQIIENIWPCLKPGGILVYSTCTFNLWEDEGNVRWIQDTLGAEVVEVPVLPEWKITPSLGGEKLPVYRFLPHKTVGEGFFMAVLRKPVQEDAACAPFPNKDSRKKADKRKAVVTTALPNVCKTWLKNASSYHYEWFKDTVRAIPQIYQHHYEILSSTLRVLHAGVTLGSLKGKDLIPAHCLAMSSQLADVFPICALSYEQAIAYLRKEAIVLDSSIPKGFVLLTYKNQALGFVKNVGNRANNLYPQEWKIRSGYLPAEVIVVA